MGGIPATVERLNPAMDDGAKRVLIPSENSRDFADAPNDVLDKLQIIFFSDPVNAAFRAMGIDWLDPGPGDDRQVVVQNTISARSEMDGRRQAPRGFRYWIISDGYNRRHEEEE